MTLRISVIAFLVAVFLSVLPYDLHQLGLGTVAAILCFWMASAVPNRWAAWGIFVPTSIATAQLLVTIRRMVCEQGVYQALESDEALTMYLVGDVLYGFKHLALTLYTSVVAVVEYFGSETALTKIEGLNPRLFVVGWLIVGMSIYLLFRRRPENKQIPK